MNQQALSNLSLEELNKKHTAVKTVVWLLIIVLIGALGFFIYISIQDGIRLYRHNLKGPI